jgi:hypothetical protein
MLITLVGLMNQTEKMQLSEECICNSGKTNFDSIEFHTTSSRLEIVCGKCHGIICWWPISTEKILALGARGKEKSFMIPAKTQVK